MSPLFVAKFMLLNALATGGTDASLALGHFKWMPSNDSVAFYRIHHAPVPTGQIVLATGGLFRYTMADELGAETTLGTYAVEANRVIFKIELGPGAGLPLKMRLDETGLSATGSLFIRQKLETEAPARREAAVPPLSHTEIEGTWTLRSSGMESRVAQFAFTGAGTFRFRGQGCSSSGVYKITDDGIELTYTEIDGEPTEAGSHFRKTLPFFEGRTAFQVDTYRYERASG